MYKQITDPWFISYKNNQYYRLYILFMTVCVFIGSK